MWVGSTRGGEAVAAAAENLAATVADGPAEAGTVAVAVAAQVLPDDDSGTRSAYTVAHAAVGLVVKDRSSR